MGRHNAGQAKNVGRKACVRACLIGRKAAQEEEEEDETARERARADPPPPPPKNHLKSITSCRTAAFTYTCPHSS
jgi:hypothetical protein